MDARYVFAVTVRIEPSRGLSVDPNTIDLRLFRPADEPGEPGWRFFRDNLWRGDIADDAHLRRLTEDALGLTVLAIEFRAFETDDEYLEALREAIVDDLAAFKDDSVDSVLNKYFGSRIEVR